MTTLDALNLGCCSLRYLVCAAQSGDNDAFVELMDRYEGLLRACIGHQSHDCMDADDMLQTVRLRAFMKIHQLREPDAFVGWLARIARNSVINSCKRHGRSIAIDPMTMEETCFSTECTEAMADRREQAELVRETIAGLRELDRKTLEAYYLEGHSVKAMSQMFGAPEGTIKRRLHDARNRLEQALSVFQAI